MEMTRFDVSDLIAQMIEASDIDAKEIYVLGAKHGNNFSAMVSDLITFAYADIHVNPVKHAKVAALADKFWTINKQ
jgi:hypothetical protein